MNEPRKPNQAEIDQLAQVLLGFYGNSLSFEEAQSSWEMAARAKVAVFDNYITDSPGYAGKLLMVVWPGSPSMFDVYIWTDGKMVLVEKDGKDS